MSWTRSPGCGSTRKRTLSSRMRMCRVIPLYSASITSMKASSYVSASCFVLIRIGFICVEERGSSDDAVDLEYLGIFEVDVDPVRSGDVPHVLGVGIAAVLLGCVLRERGRLPLEVALLEPHVS